MAVIAIAILVSITLVGFGVLLPFMDYFPWNRETHIVYMPDYDETQLKEAGCLYAPTKLQEGYYLANDPENGSGTLLYSNEAGESIQYHQLKGTLGIDNETDKKEVEKINGFSIDVIAKGEYITLSWEKDGYVYTLIGKQDKKIMLEIASSIKELK